MLETFYVHLEFVDKNGGWSIDLPFLCSKCGVCCTLDDFLTAGEITAKPEEHPEVHAKLKDLFEALGVIFEEDEAKYDRYIMHHVLSFSGRKVLFHLRNPTRRMQTISQYQIRYANPRLRSPQPIQKTTHRP